MRLHIIVALVALLAGCVVAVGAAPALPAAPIRVEISVDKEKYPFRGAIPLTITYTNISTETVELLANGLPAGEGFPGETFEVTSGAGTVRYTVVAIDPQVQTITLKPGQKWTRTIKELAVELSRCNIDGRPDVGAGPLPDPFGRLDEYKVRLRYEPTIRAQPRPAFNGRLTSNTIKFTVTR
jgi:hypothetical protein